MREETRTGREGRLPGEVVEIYTRPLLAEEVVEIYSRPLPARLVPPAPCQEAAAVVPPRKRRKGLWIFLACLLVLIALSAAAWFWHRPHAPARWERDYPYGPPVEEPVLKEITIASYPFGEGAVLEVFPQQGEPLTAQEIYRQVNPSVVTVAVQLDSGMGMGTGVIFSEDGYILTNHHVLEGANECVIYLDSGYSYDAKFVAGDADSDLAVVKIDQTGLSAAAFGDSEALVVGDPVYAIGNPLGYELRGTLTDGIVSAINRDVQLSGRSMNLIQTNAALNSGNSGGPLINQYGQVVGINTIKMISRYGDASVEGLGFAIPTATLKRLVNDLLTYGKVQPEPLLGITVMTLGTQLEDNLWGAEVDSVTTGSAADKAGVEPGDFIVSAGGIDVIGSDDVLRARRQYHIGDEMPMTLWRNGELIDVMLQLEDAARE